MGVCDEGSGSSVQQTINEGMACSPSDPCELNARCGSGSCSGTARDCSGMDTECGVGFCDSADGQCRMRAAREGLSCDDGNLCTSGSTCAGGSCGAGTPLDCSSLDGTCTLGVCNPADGTCVSMNAFEGQPCDIECFDGATCSSGSCQGGSSSLGCGPWAWCGALGPCDPSFYGDGSCDCGCDPPDPDCNTCGEAICDQDHCVAGGAARTDCPVSFKTNGRCDCGCQFTDPECAGNLCFKYPPVFCGIDAAGEYPCPQRTSCSAVPDPDDPTATPLYLCTWAGCADPVVEACVCGIDTYCCDVSAGWWDDVCVMQAQALSDPTLCL